MLLEKAQAGLTKEPSKLRKANSVPCINMCLIFFFPFRFQALESFHGFGFSSPFRTVAPFFMASSRILGTSKPSIWVWFGVWLFALLAEQAAHCRRNAWKGRILHIPPGQGHLSTAACSPYTMWCGQTEMVNHRLETYQSQVPTKAKN